MRSSIGAVTHSVMANAVSSILQHSRELECVRRGGVPTNLGRHDFAGECLIGMVLGINVIWQ